MVTTGFGHYPQLDFKLHCSNFELVNRDNMIRSRIDFCNGPVKDFVNISERLNLESTLCTFNIAEATLTIPLRKCFVQVQKPRS